jgi:hypothetical protein
MSKIITGNRQNFFMWKSTSKIKKKSDTFCQAILNFDKTVKILKEKNQEYF